MNKAAALLVISAGQRESLAVLAVRPVISAGKVEEIVRLTGQETPAGATHGSCRSIAERSGLSKSTIGRIWRTFELKPHRADTFKLSKDPLFVEKVFDVVGLYLQPESAVVLCVDSRGWPAPDPSGGSSAEFWSGHLPQNTLAPLVPHLGSMADERECGCG